MADVKLEGVSFSYCRGEDPILEGLSLEVPPGARLLVRGRLGSGKTTLLRLMAGLLKPQRGRALLLGVDTRDKRALQRAWRELGFVFQDPEDGLFCPTVLEELTFSPLAWGMSPKEALKLAEEAMERFELKELASRSPLELSGGQKRLLSIAVALVHRPRVLIMDEPDSHLDERGLCLLREVLSSFRGTAVVSSHCEALFDLFDGEIRLKGR